MNHSTALVQKLWNYCNSLRDDALSYGDYVEQLTVGSVAPAFSGCVRRDAPPVSLATGGSVLLFLHMADGQTNALYISEEKRRDAASTLGIQSRSGVSPLFFLLPSSFPPRIIGARA